MKAEAIERKRLLAHPALPQLVERYRVARAAWRHVASAGSLVGFTERSYCDRYLLTLPPITWTSATSAPHMDRRHYDLAFERAGRPAATGGEPCLEPERRPATTPGAGRRSGLPRAARAPEDAGTVTSWMPHTGPRALSPTVNSETPDRG